MKTISYRALELDIVQNGEPDPLRVSIVALAVALDEWQQSVESRLLKLEAPPVDMSSVMGPRRDSHEFDHASQTAGGYEREPDE